MEQKVLAKILAQVTESLVAWLTHVKETKERKKVIKNLMLSKLCFLIPTLI